MAKILFDKKENCIEATRILLEGLQVKVTDTSLRNALHDHPNYPSMLSISDVLSDYGVANLACKTNRYNLEKIPVPFVAVISGEHLAKEYYSVVQSVKDNRINYFDPELHKEKVVEMDEFVERWSSGTVLIADAKNATGEKEYSSKLWKEKRITAAKYAAILALPILIITLGAVAFINYGIHGLYPGILTLLAWVGTMFGGLLLWYELDRHNDLFEQICGTGKKTNCAAILNSKASKIAGISWSVIGFTYFMGETLFLLFSGITNPQALFIAAWLNTLALPYVFYSIYYQWRIAKQWCTLCLGVQSVLVLQIAVSVTAGWHNLTVVPVHLAATPHIFISFAIAGLIPLLLVSLLLPALHTSNENEYYKKELQRLKYNPQVFEALLAKQKKIQESTEGLGITLGNPAATRKIVKVCNPFCQPCSKAHALIEEILENNDDVQLQILFRSNPDDHKAPPVKHFLAIAERNDDAKVIKQALDDWYLAEKKDYNAFATKYPMNGELKMQDKKMEAMSEWCSKTEITFTPTVFINGHQLPAEYTISDLKYFLSI